MELHALYESVAAAAKAVEGPAIASISFDREPLEHIIAFLEQALRKRNLGLKEIYDTGLSDILLMEEDVSGFENWESETRHVLFLFARAFRDVLKDIVAGKDVELEGLVYIGSVFLVWKDKLQVHCSFAA